MKNATRHRLTGKWLGPVLSVVATLTLFANCSTEERVFESGSNNNSNNSNQDAATDSGLETDSGTVAMGNECDGRADGAGCGEMSGFICISESCRESSCGDGYLDEEADEACDDGNTNRDDGCEPETCTFSCLEDADCNDGSPCNGEETCNTEAHVCQPGVAPDTTLQVPCTLPTLIVPGDADGGGAGDRDAAAGLMGDSGLLSDSGLVGNGGGAIVDAGDPTIGFCKAGLCVPAGCGNSILQAGEECDDGNEDSNDGCKVDCTFTCKTDSECDDLDVCNGIETCNLNTHLCVAGDALDCDDDDDCTYNDCDPLLSCINSLIDEDGDGQASTELGSCGSDCNDDDDTIFDGAPELCDYKDNDCDNSVDESAPVWFLDCDGDSYAQLGATSVVQCTPPDPPNGCSGTGWTTRIPIAGDLTTLDCFDSNVAVSPAQTAYSGTAVPGKGSLPYDWNCSNAQEKEPVPTSVSTSSYCGPPIIFIPLSSVALGEDQGWDEVGSGENGGMSIDLSSDDLVVSPQQIGPILIPKPCTGAEGYTGSTQPACGATTTAYTKCATVGGSCTRLTSTTSPVQRCR